MTHAFPYSACMPRPAGSASGVQARPTRAECLPVPGMHGTAIYSGGGTVAASSNVPLPYTGGLAMALPPGTPYAS